MGVIDVIFSKKRRITKLIQKIKGLMESQKNLKYIQENKDQFEFSDDRRFVDKMIEENEEEIEKNAKKFWEMVGKE
jgi:hypothetical protein